MNVILQTDSYKLGAHWNMYPTGTTGNLAYFESRNGALFPYTILFGLQPILRKLLCGRVVTQKKINEAAAISLAHFGNDKAFNRTGWEYILRKHKGRLPIRIKAVKEGIKVPTGNVLLTVENTDKRCAWLTNYVESVLTHLWYPSTVATLSSCVKTVIEKYLVMSSDSLNLLDFMLHDFGYRSVTCPEAAEIGGAAHLVNFKGTDTVSSLPFIAENYPNLLDKNFPNQTRYDGIGYSVPASEHSIATSLGRDGEVAVTRELISRYPSGILSVVSDSYDIYNFVDTIIGKTLKDEILARDGVLVIRPDSVTLSHPTPAEEVLWILESLTISFGYSRNLKGYKVLNPKVRVLWSDGIDINGVEAILKAITDAGFAAENIATFGMGGGLLQKVNRDTQRFAFKSCWQERNGIGYDVFKQPIDSSKVSKKGRIKLVDDNGTLITVPESDLRNDLLETVFLNGKMMRNQTFDEVRENARK